MQNDKSYIKETLVIYRPADIGRRYLDTDHFDIVEKDGKMIIEPKEIIKDAGKT